MAEIKLAIGSKAEKKVFKQIVSGADAEKLFGKKIGDKFRGEIAGLNGYELEITGGSDNSGFPMRKDVDGQGRKKIVITRGLGFKSKRGGQRKRRSIRGNTISADTAQVNCKVLKAGKDKLAKLLGAPKEEKPAEEAPKAEEKVEEKKEEAKPEEKPNEKQPKEEAKEEPKTEEKKEEPNKEEAPEKPAEEKSEK